MLKALEHFKEKLSCDSLSSLYGTINFRVRLPILFCVLTILHPAIAADKLEFPADGRWSVASTWQDQWPTGWKHAEPDRKEVVGEWTLFHGKIELEDGDLLLRDAERTRPDGLTELRRRWTWTGEKPLNGVTLTIRTQWSAKETRPFLPGISYYDNPAGQSVDPTRIPVIGTKPGAKGFYEEHRFPMPFVCVEGVSQASPPALSNKATNRPQAYSAAALHSIPSPIKYGNRPDQWWSLGMNRINEELVELAVYSGAVASNGKNGIIKGFQKYFLPYPDAWINLEPGAVVEKTVYLQQPVDVKYGSGFQPAIADSLRIFDMSSTDGYTPYREILALKMADSVSRYREGKDFAGIDAFPGDRRPWIDLGWAGQSEAVAYPFIILGEEFDIPEARKIAQKSLDFICSSPFTEEGFSIRYDYKKKEWWDRRNPLSQGQAMNNMFNALRLARQFGGYDTSKWEQFLEKACRQHAERILADDWNPVSTNEGFLIAPLVQAAGLLGDPYYINAAYKAAEHYLERHLDMEEPYWGGTLDARCEDKEGAWAALQGFLAMYESTMEQRYLDAAEHAGDIILSYMYVWDVTMPPGRLADHAFRSRGWTSVSVQNMHLDVYGVLCAPAIWKVGEYTGRENLKTIARLLTVPCGQLTDPWGSAGEQLHQTNYVQHYDPDPDNPEAPRGDYVENWNVYWITAHFLNAAAQFTEMGVDCMAW